MDRFGGREPFRFDDPGDGGTPFVGNEGPKGSTVIDLRNALLLDDLTAASIQQQEGADSQVYALGMSGVLFGTEDERRSILVILTSESAALVVAELSRVSAMEGDEEFLTAFTGLLLGHQGNGS